MMALLDAVKKKSIPAEFKCRQVFPTNGTRSTSLWDAPDVSSLQEWLDEFLDADCNSEVHQVQEQFAYGISAELSRIRATERVSDQTRATAAAVTEKVGEFDAKLKVSEHAAAAFKSARETNLAKKTGEIFSGVGRQAQTSYSKALENERIAAATTAINSNISSGWKTLSSSIGGLVRGGTSTLPQSAPPTDAPHQQEAPALRPSHTSASGAQHSAAGDKSASTASGDKPAGVKSADAKDPFTLGDDEDEPPVKR
jgi:hypothetical protein